MSDWQTEQQITEIEQLRHQLATAIAHLEAQRLATYQAVAREHEAKRALATACRIIRDGYQVVPITPADVDWAIQALAKEEQP